jgi:hypothetical protein
MRKKQGLMQEGGLASYLLKADRLPPAAAELVLHCQLQDDKLL